MKTVLRSILFAVCIAGLARAEERTQRFDRDPGWEGVNNRSQTPERRTIRQDFGYHLPENSKRGRIGGLVTPAAETSYYGRKIEPKSFADPLTASGTLLVKGSACHLLVGFFNSKTVNEWRTPNTIALRILGRGDHFFAYVEYTTSKWRAGGDSPGGFATVKNAATGRMDLRGFKCDTLHQWSLKYDPAGNKGGGAVTVTIGDETAVCHLDEGHKQDGAKFDRFGLLPVLKSADGGGEVWLHNVAIDGTPENLTSDPKWEGLGNRRTYETADVRPRFDFGFSASHYAGGEEFGELGGNVFRGDCRFKSKLAAYGDRLKPLTMEHPLRAKGKVALRRGVSDSTVLLGFYHSKESLVSSDTQSSGLPKSFLGIAVEGPSRDGFLFYPTFRNAGAGQGYANGNDRPHILPDGRSHDWSLKYDPQPSGGGRILVTFDGKDVILEAPAADRKTGAAFDRFGLVTTWIDGNAQRIYFDDLTYTCAP
jgi:hypothetical protein